VGRRQKTALLGLFSASFPHPVQGVSPAAHNEPGSQVYGHLALALHHSLFCRASQPVPKKAHWLLFCSLKAQTGSLRILAASRILFKGTYTLSPSKMTLRSISQLRAKAFYRVRSVTSVHLSNHHYCCALPSFSISHPLSWTTVPFLHTSIYNDLGDDGRRWFRRRDQAVVTRRGPSESLVDKGLAKGVFSC
jgi:hypothetical protein